MMIRTPQMAFPTPVGGVGPREERVILGARAERAVGALQCTVLPVVAVVHVVAAGEAIKAAIK